VVREQQLGFQSNQQPPRVPGTFASGTAISSSPSEKTARFSSALIVRICPAQLQRVTAPARSAPCLCSLWTLSVGWSAAESMSSLFGFTPRFWASFQVLLDLGRGRRTALCHHRVGFQLAAPQMAEHAGHLGELQIEPSGDQILKRRPDAAIDALPALAQPPARRVQHALPAVAIVAIGDETGASAGLTAFLFVGPLFHDSGAFAVRASFHLCLHSFQPVARLDNDLREERSLWHGIFCAAAAQAERRQPHRGRAQQTRQGAQPIAAERRTAQPARAKSRFNGGQIEMKREQFVATEMKCQSTQRQSSP
jgi:hypothetical protein